MSRGAKLRFVFFALIFGCLILFSVSFLRSENVLAGNKIGFVYDEGGTTPLEGPAVEFKIISTGVFAY